VDLSHLAVFAAALLIAAGSPGPSIAALVARVLTRGAGSVLPFLLAMWVGEALWLTLAVFGLAYLAQAFQPVFAVLKYVGVAYLLWLAYRMWTAPADVHGVPIPSSRSSLRLFLAGLAVTLGNPKIMVFYLALLPSIVDLAQVTLSGWALLTATMIAVLVFVDVAWVLLAREARRLLKSTRAVRLANRASASLMGGAAAAIASQ
jgi:threonine/homoserine/homoserine lactone efflux protein